MLDEVLFMEARLFRMFREQTGLGPKDSNRLFEEQGIWRFIEDCYDSFHLGSDELRFRIFAPSSLPKESRYEPFGRNARCYEP